MVSAKSRIKRFTLIELLTVAAVIAIMISLLMPAMTYMIDIAQAATCRNNLYQVGTMTTSYSTGYDGMLPVTNRITGGELRKNTTLQMVLMDEFTQIPVKDWKRDSQGNFRDYGGSFSPIFKCPKITGGGYNNNELATGLTFQNAMIRGSNTGTEIDPEGSGTSTRTRWSGTRLSSIANPSTKLIGFDGHCFGVDGTDFGTGKVTVGDSYNSYIPGTGYFVDSYNVTGKDRLDDLLTGRHQGSVNTLYFDGHVRNVNGKETSENYYRAKTETNSPANFMNKNAVNSSFNPFLR